MAQLKDLPVDIKFIILENITDFDSLVSLVSTSRGFYQVYQNYRDTIRQMVQKAEVSIYKLEAFYIGAFHTAATIFNEWPFWEFMAVKRVKDFIWASLAPFFIYWQQFLLDTNPHAYGQPWPELTAEVFGIIAIYMFPGDIIRWLQFERSEDPEDQYTIQMALEIHEIARTGGKGPDPLAFPSSHTPGFFVDYLNVTHPGSCGNSKEIWKETDPIRICKPEHKPFGQTERYGQASWVRPLRSRDPEDVDLSLCVWDDWRLESWGYVMPVFSENIESPTGILDVFCWRTGLFGDVLKSRTDAVATFSLSVELPDVWW
ncbi:hypothetical protein ABW20_dc0103869 [Dactylellina cionopaga]|nr:hypothetical protein ABW20_dc0103869 [Dactylellina cionopaga]